MAVAFRRAANAASLTVSKPTGTAQDDIILAFVIDEGNHTLTPPDGTWTQVLNVQDSSSTLRHALWWKLAGGSEPSTYTWTISGATYTEIMLVSISGANTSTPINASAQTSATGTGNPANISTITTTVDNCLISLMMNDWNGLDWSTHAPSSYTLDTGITTSAALDGATFHKSATTAGSYGGEATTFQSGVTPHTLIIVAVAPAVAATTAPSVVGQAHAWFNRVTRQTLTQKSHVFGGVHEDTLRFGLAEQMFGTGTQVYPWQGPDETAISGYRWKQRRNLVGTEGAVDAFRALVTPIQSNSTLFDEVQQTFGYYPSIPEFGVVRTVPTSLVALATAVRTVPTSLVVLQTSTRTVPTSLVALQTSTRTVPTSLVVLETRTRTVPTSLVVLETRTRTVPTSLVVLQTSTRTVPTSLVVLETRTRTVPTSLVVLATLTRTVPTSLVVWTPDLVRTVPTSLVVLATSTRTVPTSLVVSSTGPTPRTVPTSLVVLETRTRTVSTSLVVLATLTRTVTTSLVVQQVNITRTVPTSLVVFATKTRTVPTSLVSLETRTRTAPTSLVVRATLVRTVLTSLVLLQVNITRTVPTSLVVVPTGFVQPGTVGGTDYRKTAVGGTDYLKHSGGPADRHVGTVGGKDS